MRSGITKAVSVMVAATLASSLVPAHAFAADETTAATSSLGIKLESVQLSVDTPTDIIFERTEDGVESGYEIQNPDSWGSLRASVPFTNRTESEVYLAGADVLQKDGARVSEIFNGPLPNGDDTIGSSSNPFLTLRATDGGAAATCAKVNPAVEVTAMDFSDTWVSTFTIAKGASAKGTTATFDLSLDKTAALVKSDLVVDPDGSVTNFAQIAWTFAMVPDFYLQVGGELVSLLEAEHAGFVPDKGDVYTLGQVSVMANDIAKNQESSQYYAMFDAMVGDASEQYECMVRWNDAYDVRVVGINHDDLTRPEDGRTKAGLTFQFKNLMKEVRGMSSGSSSVGGWGKSQLRADMNPGIDEDSVSPDTNAIWNTIPLGQQSAFKTVKKQFSSTHTEPGTAASSDDKVFIASFKELAGDNVCSLDDASTKYKDQTWLDRLEGEQYAYYAKRGVVGDFIDQPVLAKSKQGETRKILYYQRTLRPKFDDHYAVVNGTGIPCCGSYPCYRVQGILPCFCL